MGEGVQVVIQLAIRRAVAREPQMEREGEDSKGCGKSSRARVDHDVAAMQISVNDAEPKARVVSGTLMIRVAPAKGGSPVSLPPSAQKAVASQAKVGSRS